MMCTSTEKRAPMTEPGRLAGKAALITGAGNGMGYAMATLFAQQGAQVAAVSLHSESLKKLRDVENVSPIQADITRLEDINRMIDEAEARFGKLDIVCNVAGIHDQCYPLHETTDELWDRVVDLDLKAPFRVCRKALVSMIPRGSGVILNIGSAYAAIRGNHGASYTAAKHGVVGLTLSIAVAYASRGIRCNAIHPGSVNTQISAHSGGTYHAEGAKLVMDLLACFPGKRECEPEDVARTALFLCSDDASHVNGAIVAVDGGLSAC
jgi:NAD(P)-dependent dehydrogenase (short-subunit alcohol dehydrogenase family)